MEVIKPTMATELFNKRQPIMLAKGQEVRSFGTVKKDGHYYSLLRLQSDPKFHNLVGVRVNSHADPRPYLEEMFSYTDKVRYSLEKVRYDTAKWIDGFIHPHKRTKIK